MLFLVIVCLLLLLIVPRIFAGKDKDFNKFMWNFRN